MTPNQTSAAVAILLEQIEKALTNPQFSLHVQGADIPRLQAVMQRFMQMELALRIARYYVQEGESSQDKKLVEEALAFDPLAK